MTTTILFADNDVNFLQTRKEFLTQEGWHVIPANSFSEAKKALELSYLNLAILDIRLEDDNDERDGTGIELAKAMGRRLPIIMLTGNPSVEYVREALKPDNSAAVDFIAKADGGEALVMAVHEVLTKRRICIIHGHSRKLNTQVKNFIESLRLETTSLQDKPSGDIAIIEKFEEQVANVSFAVAIMAGDDEGYPRGKANEKQRRARQNIIFEIGYFAAKLGRSNIIILHEWDVEMPSDLSGILSIPIDDTDEWRSKLFNNFFAKRDKLRWGMSQSAKVKYERWNPDLRIVFNDLYSTQTVVELILDTHALDRKDTSKQQELTKFFQEFFYEYDKIRLDIISTSHSMPILAKIYLEKRNGNKNICKLLKISTPSWLKAELSSYENLEKLADWTLDLDEIQEYVHFGAALYKTHGKAQLGHMLWFDEYYRRKSPEKICRILQKHLLSEIHMALYEQQCQPESDKTLAQLYQQDLSLDNIERKFEGLVEELMVDANDSYDIEGYRRDDYSIQFHMNGESLEFPRLADLLTSNVLESDTPVSQRLTLGNMTGHNFLVEDHTPNFPVVDYEQISLVETYAQKIWIVDFQEVRPRPLLADLVQLEAQIRFKWTDIDDLQELLLFEDLLSDTLFLELPELSNDFQDKKLSKAFKVISVIRERTNYLSGSNAQDYQIGILFHALQVLTDRMSELEERIHAMITIAILYKKLTETADRNP